VLAGVFTAALGITPRSTGADTNNIPLEALRDLGAFGAVDKEGNPVDRDALAKLLDGKPATISFGFEGCGTAHASMHTMLADLKKTIPDLVYVVIDVDPVSPEAVLNTIRKEMQKVGMQGDMVVLYPKDPQFIEKLQNDRGEIAARDPRDVGTVALYGRSGKQLEVLVDGQTPSQKSIGAANAPAVGRSR
jgi:hypothetical protein